MTINQAEQLSSVFLGGEWSEEICLPSRTTMILISRMGSATSRNSDKEKVLGQYYYPDDD